MHETLSYLVCLSLVCAALSALGGVIYQSRGGMVCYGTSQCHCGYVAARFHETRENNHLK